MRWTLTKAGLFLTTASSIGLVRPALAQQSQFLSGNPVGQTTKVQDEGSSRLGKSRQRAIDEINIELAWLADPATFPCHLKAYQVGETINLRGFVPNDEVRQRAVQIAGEHTTLTIQDGLRKYSSIPYPPTGVPVNVVRGAAADALVRCLGEAGRSLEVAVSPGGKVVVTGNVATATEKLAISEAMCRVHGCTSVINSVTTPDMDQSRASASKPLEEKVASVAPSRPTEEKKPHVAATKSVEEQKLATTVSKHVDEKKPMVTPSRPAEEKKPLAAATKPVEEQKPATTVSKLVDEKKPAVAPSRPIEEQKPLGMATKTVEEQKPAMIGSKPEEEKKSASAPSMPSKLFVLPESRPVNVEKGTEISKYRPVVDAKGDGPAITAPPMPVIVTGEAKRTETTPDAKQSASASLLTPGVMLTFPDRPAAAAPMATGPPVAPLSEASEPPYHERKLRQIVERKPSPEAPEEMSAAKPPASGVVAAAARSSDKSPNKADSERHSAAPAEGSYVASGVITYEAPSAPSASRIKTNLAKLKEQIGGVCGSAAKHVEIESLGGSRLMIRMECSTREEGERLSRKVLQMRELAPYEVSLEMKIAP
jgi:osmotically-inducible protein OsmY